MRTKAGFLCAQLACAKVERDLAHAVTASSLRETASHDARREMRGARERLRGEGRPGRDAARAGGDRDELGCGHAPVQQA
jgi:hypothetical protein